MERPAAARSGAKAGFRPGHAHIIYNVRGPGKPARRSRGALPLSRPITLIYAFVLPQLSYCIWDKYRIYIE